MQRSASFSTDDISVGENGLKMVKGSIRRRAQSASNFMCGAPPNVIDTDVNGVVTSVTPGFLEFTGYEEMEMVGRKCNFLQGEETDPEDILALRSAMKKERQASVVILNYCKDGTPFWNVLTIIPEFKNKSLVNYHGEVINLRIPPHLRKRPQLCLDDALALISVYSSVPRTLRLGGSPDDKGYSIDADTVNDVLNKEPPEPPSEDAKPSLYRHVNYGKRFTKEGDEQDAQDSNYVFVAETSLPTCNGRFTVRAYRNEESGAEPLAMICGDLEGQSNVVVRVHDQCVTSEVFGSLRCDCKQQLDFALQYIQEHDKGGMVLYLPQEGRGIGLANKVAAYAAQETGLDTVDANRHLGLPDDAREYDSVRDILYDMGVKSIQLLTNNPRKIQCLEALGINVTQRLPCVVVPNSGYSMNYVHAKAARMGHMINMGELSSDFKKSEQ